MIPRTSESYLKALSESYPIVSVVGPRQSGKTTLVRETFSKKPYVSLEDLDQRRFAQEDPRGFLRTFKNGGILDEVQNCPDLFSYIQTDVDQEDTVGKFILTGSQNFLLMEKISQTLSGRTGMLELLPLSYKELSERVEKTGIFELIFKGGYPRLYTRNIPPENWYKMYVKTYIERDVRQIKNVLDLGTFELFLKLCAGRIGQITNLTSLGNECGVSYNTIKQWISVLSSSYVTFLLSPHHKNFNKRLVKNPKLYFYDTGVACSLLGIRSSDELRTHYARGVLFENFVILEMIKKRLNVGQDPSLYFWRDNHGHEVDIIFEGKGHLVPVEIKSSSTVNSEFLKSLKYWNKLSAEPKGYLIYGGESKQLRSDGIQILSWKQINEIEAFS